MPFNAVTGIYPLASDEDGGEGLANRFDPISDTINDHSGVSGKQDNDLETNSDFAIGQDREDGEFRQVPPDEILSSPFGDNINLAASAAEDVALESSIAEKGVLIPLVCEMTGKGQFRCLAGTRRLRIAKKLKLTQVPVKVMQFESREEARQFAIRDNIERRQLSLVAKARLANQLWASYEKPGHDGKRVESSRKRAATAAGLAEGSLANFRYVIDSQFDDIVTDLLAEKITIDAAFRAAKARVDGQRQIDIRRNRMVRSEQVFDGLKQVIDILGRIPKLSEQVVAHIPGVAGRGSKNDQKQLLKKLTSARGVLEKCQADAVVAKLVECLARVEAEFQ